MVRLRGLSQNEFFILDYILQTALVPNTYCQNPQTYLL